MTGTPAAALTILSGGGIMGPMNELGPRFERETGGKVVIRYEASPALIACATSGAPFDLCVAPREVFANAAVRARFTPAPTTDIARDGLGVAYRSGAPKPDIGTPEKLKAALLAARGVSTLLASATGGQIMNVLKTLGIAEAMQPKLKLQPSPAAIPQAVANGEAELGVFLINVLLAPGVELAGPFPPEVQQELVFTSAVTTDSQAAGTARAFIDYLKTPAAAAVIRSKGMQPAA